MIARPATTADTEAVVDVLTRSHVDYAWEAWMLPGPDRLQRLRSLVRAEVELRLLPAGEVWITDDGASVAAWQSPDAPPPDHDALRRLESAAAAAIGQHLAAAATVEGFVAARRPAEPHWFLGTMGTIPERQRRGGGTAVLQPVLQRLDRLQQPACLETSSNGNVEFYRGLGFDVIATMPHLPHGAPPTWVMWRPPSDP